MAAGIRQKVRTDGENAETRQKTTFPFFVPPISSARKALIRDNRKPKITKDLLLDGVVSRHKRLRRQTNAG